MNGYAYHRKKRWNQRQRGGITAAEERLQQLMAKAAADNEALAPVRLEEAKVRLRQKVADLHADLEDLLNLIEQGDLRLGYRRIEDRLANWKLGLGYEVAIVADELGLVEVK